jgi:protein-tyrosine phosphatase
MNHSRTDFHSHILPRLDDGAANVEESLMLLDVLKEDGVTRVVATPHLYLHRHPADVFLRRREASVNELFDAIGDRSGDYPEVVIGAEVYYSPALSDMELADFCISGTDYMLLELPYRACSSDFMRELTNFFNSCNVKIILAHVERYFEFYNPDVMDEIMSHGLLMQANCDSVIDLKTRKRVLKLIESGKIHLLGTDLHGLDYRPPEFAEAERIIEKKLSPSMFEKLMKAADMALNNASADEILSL